MVSVSVENLAGTVALLILYVALNPIIKKSLEILVPQLGPTESLIARAIPVVLLLAIVGNVLKEETTDLPGPR